MGRINVKVTGTLSGDPSSTSQTPRRPRSVALRVRTASENAYVADSALILGVTGILTSGTVGIAAPWISARFKADEQKRAFEHERTMRDEEELRRVLDEVAAAIERCELAMGAAHVGFLKHSREFGERPAAQETLEGIDAPSTELWALCGRLSIRLGAHHGLTRAAKDCRAAVGAFAASLLTIASMRDEANLIEEGTVLEQALEDLRSSRGRFIQLAVEFAGSRLPRKPLLELGITEAPARRED